jgi:multidrug resistance efflux pump
MSLVEDSNEASLERQAAELRRMESEADELDALIDEAQAEGSWELKQQRMQQLHELQVGPNTAVTYREQDYFWE